MLREQFALTVSQMQSDQRHNVILRGEHPVLGEPEHQTLEHLVAHSATSFPEQRPQIVAGRFAAVVAALVFLEGEPPELQHAHQHGNVHDVDATADVVVPQHYEALAQLQARLFGQKALPVRLEELLELTSIEFRRILGEELVEDYFAFRLEGRFGVLFFGRYVLKGTYEY